MKTELDIQPEFYYQHVGVPFKNLSILWRLLDERPDVIYHLTDFKARRKFKKGILIEKGFHDNKMPTSKFVEKHVKNPLSNANVQKSIREDLNVIIGDYLESLSERLANHYFLETFTKKQTSLRKEYLAFAKNNKSRLSPREINKAFRNLHPEINPNTLRTWAGRNKR